MQLTLVRHGEAAPPIMGNDTKRPLTERGHAQAEQTADFLKSRIQPDVLWLAHCCVRRKHWHTSNSTLRMCLL